MHHAPVILRFNSKCANFLKKWLFNYCYSADKRDRSKPLKTPPPKRVEKMCHMFIRYRAEFHRKAKAHWPSIIVNVQMQDQPYSFTKLREFDYLYTVHAIQLYPIRPAARVQHKAKVAFTIVCRNSCSVHCANIVFSIYG